MSGITGVSTTDVSRISLVISLWPFALAIGLQNRPKNVCPAAEKQTLARNLLSSKTSPTFTKSCKILFLNVIFKNVSTQNQKIRKKKGLKIQPF
jgi:predicted RNase H-like nuclease